MCCLGACRVCDVNGRIGRMDAVLAVLIRRMPDDVCVLRVAEVTDTFVAASTLASGIPESVILRRSNI